MRQYNPQQLVKGMYAEFLPDWLRVWPRDQLLLLRNEDYKVSQKEHMAAVFRWAACLPFMPAFVQLMSLLQPSQ